MDIVVEAAEASDKQALRNLLQLYLYDFSELDGSDVDDAGLFHYRYVDLYWAEAERHAFLIRADGAIAGFALVREMHPTEMAEFFVLRRYRQAGVGRVAASQLLQLFAGDWRITQIAANPGATAFWRRVIPPRFDERVLSNGVVEQRFTVAATPMPSSVE